MFLPTFQTRFGAKLKENEPLSKHTTLRLGGPARYWLTVNTLEGLAQAVQLARANNLPSFILGGGANILLRESGFDGLVIQNRAKTVDFPDTTGLPNGDTVTVRVDSGVVMPNFARRCAQRQISGFEWAVGVPGTMGGAVVNNAGAHGGDIARNLLRAELLGPNDERVWQSVEWFEYDYRRSWLKGQTVGQPEWIVLQAEFQFRIRPTNEIEADMSRYTARRRKTQPAGATIGSMFKNPPDDYAGRLIEAAGLKGYQVGGAQISTLHANFFQNLGDATATDVLTLIETARQTVWEQFGVDLELEIQVIG